MKTNTTIANNTASNIMRNTVTAMNTEDLITFMSLGLTELRARSGHTVGVTQSSAPVQQAAETTVETTKSSRKSSGKKSTKSKAKTKTEPKAQASASTRAFSEYPIAEQTDLIARKGQFVYTLKTDAWKRKGKGARWAVLNKGVENYGATMLKANHEVVADLKRNDEYAKAIKFASVADAKAYMEFERNYKKA